MSNDPDNEITGQGHQELIRLPDNTKEFTGASGAVYRVEETLSIERYKHFNHLEIELGYSLNFAELHGNFTRAYQLQNESKFADVSVILYRLMEGSTHISEKEPMAMYVATLFINEVGEDRTVWNKAVAEKKLADWKHYDVGFFLLVALGKVDGFKKSFSDVSRLLTSVGEVRIPENLMPDTEADSSDLMT